MQAFALSIKSEGLEVAATAAAFEMELRPGLLYRYTSSVDSWVLVGLADAELTAGGAGAILCMAGQVITLASPYEQSRRPKAGVGPWFAHAIRDSADGDASLTPYVVVGEDDE